MSAYLARTGLAVFALLLAIAMLTEHEAAGDALVASATTLELPALRELSPIRAVAVARVAVAGVETAPQEAVEVALPPVLVAPVILPAVPVGAADATVLASWYGPGFYGNRTACGQTYTPEILGVAHLTLPCGTALTLTYGGRSLTVHVIDRGPYVAGRAIDLSSATKLALGCTDLCTVRMQIGR
jgi:hypothetical protein